MKYAAYAAGRKGQAPILITDSLNDAITAAYEGCGWVETDEGNVINLVDDDGCPLFPELVPEDMQ